MRKAHNWKVDGSILRRAVNIVDIIYLVNPFLLVADDYLCRRVAAAGFNTLSLILWLRYTSSGSTMLKLTLSCDASDIAAAIRREPSSIPFGRIVYVQSYFERQTITTEPLCLSALSIAIAKYKCSKFVCCLCRQLVTLTIKKNLNQNYVVACGSMNFMRILWCKLLQILSSANWKEVEYRALFESAFSVLGIDGTKKLAVRMNMNKWTMCVCVFCVWSTQRGCACTYK